LQKAKIAKEAKISKEVKLRHLHNKTIVIYRLLAWVVKEGVQFWYTDTSTIKRGEGGGGVEKTSSGKPLKFTLLHVSICSKLV
jgi:hypothetical protein